MLFLVITILGAAAAYFFVARDSPAPKNDSATSDTKLQFDFTHKPAANTDVSENVVEEPTKLWPGEEHETLFVPKKKAIGYREFSYSDLYEQHIIQAMLGSAKSQAVVAMALMDCVTSKKMSEAEIDDVTYEVRGAGLPDELAQSAISHAKACNTILSLSGSNDVAVDAQRWAARSSEQSSAVGTLFEIDRGWRAAPESLEDEVTLIVSALQESNGEQLFETLALYRAYSIMHENPDANRLKTPALQLLWCDRHFRCELGDPEDALADYAEYEIEEIISKANSYRRAIDEGDWSRLRQLLLDPP